MILTRSIIILIIQNHIISPRNLFVKYGASDSRLVSQGIDYLTFILKKLKKVLFL